MRRHSQLRQRYLTCLQLNHMLLQPRVLLPLKADPVLVQLDRGHAAIIACGRRLNPSLILLVRFLDQLSVGFDLGLLGANHCRRSGLDVSERLRHLGFGIGLELHVVISSLLQHAIGALSGFASLVQLLDFLAQVSACVTLGCSFGVFY